MRRTYLFSILALTFACTGNVGPANNLSGTWSANYSFPGSSLVLTLSQQGPSITGTGTYQIEAGRAGTLQVVGGYRAPSLNLTLHYDTQSDAVYVGTVQDASHITGALNGYAVPLVRQ